MTTGKLAAWGPASARSRAAARLALLRPAPPMRREARRRVVPDNLSKSLPKCQLLNANCLVILQSALSNPHVERTTEYSANGSFSNHTSRSGFRVHAFLSKNNLWSSLTAD
jgi:hypothetical protein